MPQGFGRERRVAEELRRVLSELIRRELKDPRVEGLTITEVEVARDLSHATVFYTPLDPEADRDAVQQGLERAAGFLRSKLARRMSTRTVPKLNFRFDTAIEQGDRMGQILSDLDLGEPGLGADAETDTEGADE
jgi:ribosome-binding factor A